MRLWGALLLITFLSDASARIIDVSTIEEENSGIGASRPDKEREGRSESLSLPQEETEEPVSVLSPAETSSAGGGLRLLDPKFLEPKGPVLPADASWWERCWLAISSWFSGD